VAQFISNPLSEVFNISLSVGEFPDKLKLAKVIPVYKTDDKLCVNNYRPISVLSVFSILERLVYDRLFSSLDDSKTLTDKQYGFRERHSAYMDMAILNLIEKITEEIDSKKLSLVFLLICQKLLTLVTMIYCQKNCYSMESVELLRNGL